MCAYQSKFVRFGLAVLLLVSLKCNCTRIACVVPPVLLRIYGTMIFRGGRGGGGGGAHLKNRDQKAYVGMIRHASSKDTRAECPNSGIVNWDNS